MGLISEKALEKLIFSGIVFNMSWEDPYMDRDSLKVGPGDTCASIMSGGCNVLSLLCWNPDRVIAIDQNDAQASLTELKVAGIRTLDWKTFSDIFGDFDTMRFFDVYRNTLRPQLSDKARAFWDRRRNQKVMKKGLQVAGKNGVFLRLLRMYLRSVIDFSVLEGMFDITDKAELDDYYTERIEPAIMTTFIRRVCEVGKPYFWLAGVHPTQLEVVERDMPLYEYIRIRMRKLVTANLPRENYFLASSVLGRFINREVVPPYLQEQHWATMRKNIDRFDMKRGWFHLVLDELPEGTVTKYSLLDAVDWMNDEQLDTFFRSVIRAGRDGGLLVYRSGGVDFQPPASVIDALPQTEAEVQISRQQLDKDLSGIYMDFKLRHIDKSKLKPKAEKPVLVGAEA